MRHTAPVMQRVHSIPAIIVVSLAAAIGTAIPASAKGSSDGTVEHSADGSSPIAVLKGSGGLNARFSADGKLLLTSGEWSARLWDARTFRPVTEPLMQRGPITVAVLSEDAGKILTAGKDGSARVWDARTGKTMCMVRHSCAIVAAAFDPAAKRIVTGGDRDKTAAVWDVTTGRLLYLLKFGRRREGGRVQPVGRPVDDAARLQAIS